MKMKVKSLTLAAFGIAAWLLAATVVFAGLETYSTDQSNSDEAPEVSNAQNSLLAVVNQSTGTNPQRKTRRLITNDFGDLNVRYSVRRSSFITIGISSNVKIINGIDTSTDTVYRSTQGVTFSSPDLPNVTTHTPVFNQHVYCIGSSSQPCTNLELRAGPRMVNIRIFDTRGSTPIGSLVWEGTIGSSMPVATFNIPFSSGIRMDATSAQGGFGGGFFGGWNPPKQGADGLTR